MWPARSPTASLCSSADGTAQLVSITINGANDAPVGVDDAGSATEAGGTNNGSVGSDATGNVLGNDTDVDTAAASRVVAAVRTGATRAPAPRAPWAVAHRRTWFADAECRR